MKTGSFQSKTTLSTLEPPLQRPYLPCLPAPVYRVQGSHSTSVVPRAPATLQTGPESPEQRSVLLTQTPSNVDILSAAAAPERGTRVGEPEAFRDETEGPAPALSRWGGGEALKAEEDIESEPYLETQAGLKSELQLESGGPGPDSDPGAKAGPDSELLGASGTARPRPKLRRNRTVFSVKQVSTLERAFQENPYPSFEDVVRLAQELSITEAQVKVWFQNRRKKLKRQLQEQTQFFALTLSDPFWTLGIPMGRLQPDYHTHPFLHGQPSATSPSTCVPGFGHSFYGSQDLQSVGLQMLYPNFSSRSLS